MRNRVQIDLRVRSKVLMITQRFAVELERHIVGIAVRVPGGFVFYASDDRFNRMDGRVFPRARAIERQLKRVAKQHAGEAPPSQVNASFV